MKRYSMRIAGAAIAAGGMVFAALAHAGDDKMQMMDANKDGMVSAAEHAAGARQMFTKMDANGDGSVNSSEMDAVARTAGDTGTAAPKMSSAEKIRALDGNGDGSITAAEHESASRDKFARLDANGDGSLTASELQAAHAAPAQDRTN